MKEGSSQDLELGQQQDQQIVQRSAFDRLRDLARAAGNFNLTHPHATIFGATTVYTVAEAGIHALMGNPMGPMATALTPVVLGEIVEGTRFATIALPNPSTIFTRTQN